MNEYELLEPIPDGSGGTINKFSVDPNNLSYFITIYSVALTLTVALSLVMIVIGGVQWSAGAMSPSARDEAKKRIGGAITGLLLAIFSWFILNTINPDLVNPKLNLPVSSSKSGGGGGSGGGLVSGGGMSQSSAEQYLRDHGIGWDQSIKLDGVQQVALNAVAALNDLEGCNCNLYITSATGGTHDANAGHYQGYKVDVRVNSKLDSYVSNAFTKLAPSKENGYARYRDPNTNAIWMRETDPPHWDVSTNG